MTRSVAVVPVDGGVLTYQTTSRATVNLDSAPAAPDMLATSDNLVIDTTNLIAGAAYSISSGAAATSGNGQWGAAFSLTDAHGIAGFLSNRPTAANAVNGGTASASATGSAPSLSAAQYDGNSQIKFLVDGVPAVDLSTSVSDQLTVTVPANALPTSNGFVEAPGTATGVHVFGPPAGASVFAADANLSAIQADVSDTGPVMLRISPGTAPVSATSLFDGRAAIGAFALSTAEGIDTTVDFSGSSLSVTTNASNAGALLSLGSSNADALTSILIGTHNAVLQTAGISSPGMVAGLVGRNTVRQRMTLAGAGAAVITGGANSWGIVNFASSQLGDAATDVDLTGNASRVTTGGAGSGGVVVTADGITAARAGLALAGADTSVATGGADALGASVIARSQGEGAAEIDLSGARASISTAGDRSTGVLVSSSGAAARAAISVTGAASGIETAGQDATAVVALAHGQDSATAALDLSGASSRVRTFSTNASGSMVTADARNATTTLSLSGDGASIETRGLGSAGHIGSALGAAAAVSTADLSGAGSAIRTYGDNSVGVALMAIATDPDSVQGVALGITGPGSAIETFGDNSVGASLLGGSAGLTVGPDGRLATTGALSHAGLFLADQATVDISTGGSVTTNAADASGLVFSNPASRNRVVNNGQITTGGTGIASAGTLVLANTGAIRSASSDAVNLASGQIFNSGLVTGLRGIVRDVAASGPVVIENRGPVRANAGPGGVGIELGGAYDDELAVSPTGIIEGTIELGGGNDRFVALPGTNLDFWFETAPETVEARSGVQLPRPDPRHVVITDPAHLTNVAAQSGLFAARMAARQSSALGVAAPADHCGVEISAQASARYSRTGDAGDRAETTSRGSGLLAGVDPEACADGGLTFFAGLVALNKEAGAGSQSQNQTLFGGGRYSTSTESGLAIDFLGGIGVMAGDSTRRVLNNRVVGGVEHAVGDYTEWLTFASLMISRPMQADTFEYRPFIRSALGYSGGYQMQESGITNPLLFDLRNSLAYEVDAGISVHLDPRETDFGSVGFSYSAALSVSGSDTAGAVFMNDGASAVFSKNSAEVGGVIGAGLDINFTNISARLQIDSLLAIRQHGIQEFEITSKFAYSF
ncbi:hypothetical protein OEG84_16960 [Hoeflea sp. G2-23]|uniref:Autotransporter domain-containing protein n=1 Tax=Hoeflea algicola TaxID=2983763 RepID=A0ABT3ZC20_9HYPH|nr:hypothetical protein [Hoeflea algicola]MCY0149353.1 hypothetical protein [Hoeflea algicola]